MAVPHNPTTEVFPDGERWRYRVHCAGCGGIIEEDTRTSRAEAEAAATTVSGAHKFGA
jgi:hypothetical protein